jgi:hypothetical protein
MHRRCDSLESHLYKYYGARNIKVCIRWRTFENFLEDMGEMPRGMSLDRKDNDGDYTPENCRWATDTEQHNNTRYNRVITFNGETRTLAQWARELGIKYSTITKRFRSPNWSIERMLTEPIRSGGYA